MASKLFYATIIGLVGAAIVHLSVIFLLPFVSSNSVWNAELQDSANGEPFVLESAPENSGRNLLLDPLFKVAACRFDLSEGAFRVTADSTPAFWSIGVFDRFGASYFSANDRIANSSAIDLAVLNPAQLRYVRQNTPDALANSIVAAANQETGFVAIRVFSPDKSWDTETDAFLSSLKCESENF